MTSRAKVYLHKDKPYYFAWFPVWDAQRQAWKPVSKSTRSKNKQKALEIAREYERIALAAGPDSSTFLSRDFVIGVINDILRIAGHRPVEDGKPWKQYAETWLEAQNKRVPHSLSLGSWKNYKAHIANFERWLGKNATLPLGAITGDMMQEWYRAGIDSGLSRGTMKASTMTLSAIFERARDEGFTQRNPASLVNMDDSQANKRDPFTQEDMEKILAHLRSDPGLQDWLTVALLGLCTSQRLTDCATATRGQFEQASPFWIWTVKQSKTGKTIRIPCVEPLASHLKHVWKQPTDSMFLAPTLAEIPTHGTKGLSPQFAEILVAAGVEGRKVERQGKGRGFHSKSFHSTRHTCNSLLANAGVPADIRRLITGHADDSTNLIYTHLEDKTKAKALQKAFAQSKKKEKLSSLALS